ncbi:MAG: AAA family ATPase [Planctomycetota bacterium]
MSSEPLSATAAAAQSYLAASAAGDDVTKERRALERALVDSAGLRKPQEESFEATPFSDIAEEEFSFWWPLWLPAGVVAAIDGAPGSGKTYLALDVAARISSGAPWPCDPHATRRPEATVAIQSAEDSASKTLKKRLRMLGADMSRCLNIGDRTLRDPETNEITSVDGSLQDVAAIRSTLKAHRPVLWIIDTLGHFLGPDASPNNEIDVKRVLRPIKELAEEFGCTFLVVRHHNKSSGTSAVLRGAGSIAITGQARILWCVGRHKDDPERRALFCGKSNVANEPLPLEYRVDSVTGEFQWIGTTDMTLGDVLGEPEKRNRAHKREDAADWLAEFLSGKVDGERMDTVQKVAEAAGFTWATVKRAAGELGVKKKGVYLKGQRGADHFRWLLPTCEVEEVQ